MRRTKISVVTVVYNAKDLIAGTVNSVLNQDYGEIEYIIVDGGSTDGTMDYLNSCKECFAHLVSERDEGIYDAMNKGTKLATGEWILFMNAGDCFVNNHVLSDVFTEKDYNQVSVIYGDTIANYTWGKAFLPARFFSQKDINLPFCHQSAFVRTDLMRKHPFDLSYKVAADYNLFYTLYKECRTFKHIELPVSQYDTTGFSTTRVISTYREVAKTKGEVGTLFYYHTLCILYIRELVMKIIPLSWVNALRKEKRSH